MSFVEQAIDPKRNQTKITGKKRLQKLRRTLQSLGLTFSEDQNEFINRMISACAKQIFKDDLHSNIDEFLEELGIEELRQEVMAIMPRRYGKTYCVAAFVVALLASIEGIEIGIFSTGRRASQKILELIYYFTTKVPGLKQHITKHNVETMWIEGIEGAGDIRKCSSYPSSVRISDFFFLGWGPCFFFL